MDTGKTFAGSRCDVDETRAATRSAAPCVTTHEHDIGECGDIRCPVDAHSTVGGGRARHINCKRVAARDDAVQRHLAGGEDRVSAPHATMPEQRLTPLQLVISSKPAA